MALPNLVVSAVAEWNGKALSKASGQIGKFDKTVKNLGRTLGVTFSAAALLGYSKKALAAYGEQIAETKRLDTALRNIGYSYATAETEGYLDAIEKATGINRDILQPSFLQLAQITKSTTIAQSMLNTAMDVSAGTGLDLGSATKILSQAYIGNYKGLQQLNLGLTKAELSSKSYLEIEKLIATQYAGQSKNAADSYQGSLNRLKIAAEQASEQIGQSLVSALSISSGGFDKLIDKVDSASDSISGMITNTSYLISELNKIPGAGVLSNIKGFITGQLGKFSIGNIRKLYDQIQGNMGGFPQGVPQDIKNMQANAEKAKADKAAIKLQKERIALEKKAALIEKNNISLSKAAETFDTNRISIAAALRATYDKETRLRLEALMAIEDEDGALALKRIEELGLLTKAKQTEKLNGLKGITETELLGLNTTLLADLAKIEATKNARIAAINASGANQAAKDAAILQAIADADAAQGAAFAKYNDALSKQGGLNDLSFYTQKTQIGVLEILRLASINNTTAAQLVADKLSLAAGVKTLEDIAAKRKLLQDADNAAMAEAATARKAAEDKAFSEYYAALAAQAAARLLADANLTTARLNSIATVAAAEAAANASAIAGVAALSAAISSIPPYPTYTPPPKSEMPGLPFADPDGKFPDIGGGLYIDPGLVNPGGGNSYDITVNAGAIASQDEFAALLQDTIQRLNRNGDPLTTAGIS